MALNRNLPPVRTDQFSMVPRAGVSRSTFVTEHKRKMTFDVDYLVPCLVREVLPGDVWQGEMTVFARLNTLLFPLMDNVKVESFFFFCPNRLVWDNFVKMMGERANPGDSISYITPYINQPNGGPAVGSIYDYMGLPTVGQVAAGQFYWHNALPFRMVHLIWNEWFRDQNLDNSLPVSKTDGPDAPGVYAMLKRRKAHDYFTSALPWPVKGGLEASLPLGMAPVKGISLGLGVDPTDGNPPGSLETGGSGPSGWAGYVPLSTASSWYGRTAQAGAAGAPLIQADLSAASVTINALRLAIATQQLLERDARGGTRYTEYLRAAFGVENEDLRLQRPEYIGGGRTFMDTQAIPQTSTTKLLGSGGAQDLTSVTPQGALVGQSTVAAQHRFQCFAKEHGFIIGLVNVTGEVTYQQGLHRQWTRSTRYDYFDPVFGHLGEQAIRNDEIYCTGIDAQDLGTFGYKEAWAEYRHIPSEVVGLFRSTSTGNIDEWHLAEQFGSLPLLTGAFMAQSTPMTRALAAGSQANGMQVLWDSVFRIRKTCAVPVYSVPGLDRF